MIFFLMNLAIAIPNAFLSGVAYTYLMKYLVATRIQMYSFRGKWMGSMKLSGKTHRISLPKSSNSPRHMLPSQLLQGLHPWYVAYHPLEIGLKGNIRRVSWGNKLLFYRLVNPFQNELPKWGPLPRKHDSTAYSIFVLRLLGFYFRDNNNLNTRGVDVKFPTLQVLLCLSINLYTTSKLTYNAKILLRSLRYSFLATNV